MILEPFDWRDNRASVHLWVRHHRALLRMYCINKYRPEAVEEAYQFLRSQPYLARTIIEDYQLTHNSKWKTFIEWGSYNHGLLILALGGKRMGKTTTASDFLLSRQAFMKSKGFDIPICQVVESGQGAFPWAMPVKSLEKAPVGAGILWDESARTANSRTSTSGYQRSGLGGDLAIIGHRKQVLVVLSQNSTMSDKNFYKLADAMILKPLGMTQSEMERGGIRSFIQYYAEMMPEEPSQTLIRTRDHAPRRVVRGLPKGWNPDWNYAYGVTPPESSTHDFTEEGTQIALELRMNGRPWTKLTQAMQDQGHRASERVWRQRVLDANQGQDPKKVGILTSA